MCFWYVNVKAVCFGAFLEIEVDDSAHENVTAFKAFPYSVSNEINIYQ